MRTRSRDDRVNSLRKITFSDRERDWYWWRELCDFARSCVLKQRARNGRFGTLQHRLSSIASLLVIIAAIGAAPAAATTLPESIPDFSLDTTRAAVRSAQSGAWSNPATWQGGQVPTSNHVVRILAGHTVTIDDTLGRRVHGGG